MGFTRQICAGLVCNYPLKYYKFSLLKSNQTDVVWKQILETKYNYKA